MELSTPELALIPVIVGLVEVVKGVGVDSKYAMVISLALGVAIVGLLETFSATSVLAGVVVGLSASGLYGGTKAVLK